MAQLTVEGRGTLTAQPGLTLLEVCDAGGVVIETDCGGFAACNSCRVTVLEGANQLSPLDRLEAPFLDRPDQRLGCQARIVGDVVVRLDPGNT